jgi:hypothetical protein
MASTSLNNFQQAAPHGKLTQVQGWCRKIIGDAVATRQLLPEESGALCLLDKADGVVYTLPTPVAGMQFEFLQTVTITSNSAKVITKTIASEFILGQINMQIAAAATTLAAAFNGSTHVAITSNGTTTGGVIGSRFKLTAISSTQWAIEGVVAGSGALATPAATS